LSSNIKPTLQEPSKPKITAEQSIHNVLCKIFRVSLFPNGAETNAPFHLKNLFADLSNDPNPLLSAQHLDSLLMERLANLEQTQDKLNYIKMAFDTLRQEQIVPPIFRV